MCRVARPGAEEDEAREGENHQRSRDSSKPDPGDPEREERVEPKRPGAGHSGVMQSLTHEAGEGIEAGGYGKAAKPREHRETRGFRARRAPSHIREEHGHKHRAGEEDQEKQDADPEKNAAGAALRS